jgi:hypothetical protein
MIRITSKGLAKFMLGGPATQRKTLRDFKFPNPEGSAQATYYSPARNAIKRYHGEGNDPSILVHEVDRLRISAGGSTDAQRGRLENNIRALQSYLKNFGQERFQVLPTPRLRFSFRTVVVSATADLHVEDGSTRKLIKLDLSKKAPDPKMVRAILQIMFQAALEGGLGVEPRNVVYLDVDRAAQYKGARVRTRLQAEIEAACRNVEALWPGIK